MRPFGAGSHVVHSALRDECEPRDRLFPPQKKLTPAQLSVSAHQNQGVAHMGSQGPELIVLTVFLGSNSHTIKFTLLKLDNSVAFSIFAKLCNHHHYLIP